MTLEELRKLADSFFEWPTEDRTQVTLTSALLFAQHVLRMTQQPDQGRLRYKSACEISGDKHPEYVRGYEAAMDAVCRAREQQPTPDVTMKVMEALATILRKAQGRIDTETGECIDIGAECMAIRREFDRISKEDRLLEALERIANMDSMSYHSLESAKITARAALGAAPQAQPSPTNKEHDNAKDAD